MTTKNTAKHSIIRGCLSRYKLALKAASRITTLDKVTCYHENKNNDTDDDFADSHYAFIISEHLSTPGNGHHAFHNWVFRISSGLPNFNIWAKSKVHLYLPFFPLLAFSHRSCVFHLVRHYTTANY